MSNVIEKEEEKKMITVIILLLNRSRLLLSYNVFIDKNKKNKG